MEPPSYFFAAPVRVAQESGRSCVVLGFPRR
jgi:hypothetical protein